MSNAFSGRPKRSLGQNFLTDPNVARKIVAAVGIEAGGVVLEIGPGRGALTGHLMESAARRVLAVEMDRNLSPELKGRYPELAIVNADALRIDWARLDALPGIRIVGNLPYNVASPIMWDLVWKAHSYGRAVFMVQNEVADRIVAKPRSRAYGGLTAWLQSFARVEKLFKVGPAVFTPRPKIDSAVVAFTPLPAEARPAEPERFSRFIKRIFSQRRKQLGGMLGASMGDAARKYLEDEGLTPAARPEELTPSQIRSLMEFVAEVRQDDGGQTGKNLGGLKNRAFPLDKGF